MVQPDPEFIDIQPHEPPRGFRAWIVTHLRLARASNLPTVLSNGVAAWSLAEGRLDDFHLLFVLLGVCLIYIGGMYLNDACDADWDRERKPDRPIPDGRIGRRQVYIWAYSFLIAGWALSWAAGWSAGLLCAALLAAVIAYDYLHKRLAWAPFLMGAARAMVYMVAAAAAPGFSVTPTVWVWGVIMGLYIVGLTYVAREEETNRLKRFGPMGLLFIPALFGLYPNPEYPQIAAVAVFLIWTLHSIFYAMRPRHRSIRKAVGALLAGVCLVDLIAASGNPFWMIVIIALFFAALLGQKRVAAT